MISHIRMCRIKCGGGFMSTNLAIDDALINEAVAVGGHRTKKAAVTSALEEYIQRHKQQKILELFGTLDYQKNYDYKKLRSRQKRQKNT